MAQRFSCVVVASLRIHGKNPDLGYVIFDSGNVFLRIPDIQPNVGKLRLETDRKNKQKNQIHRNKRECHPKKRTAVLAGGHSQFRSFIETGNFFFVSAVAASKRHFFFFLSIVLNVVVFNRLAQLWRNF